MSEQPSKKQRLMEITETTKANVKDASELQAQVANFKDELAAVKKEVAALKVLVEGDTKTKMFERALQNTDMGSFTYISTYCGEYTEKDSAVLAKQVISRFLLGRGFTFSADIEDAEDFKRKFNMQIRQLIHREPYWEADYSEWDEDCEDDYKGVWWTIYYSSFAFGSGP
jgi:hypothetical protein